MARGFAEAGALLERLPGAARERLGFLLYELAGEISAAQRGQLAAKTSGTGFLGQGIDAEVMLEQLRMRSGLRTLSQRKKSSRYYGRFVEFGRKAQTVLVTRGTASSPKSASARKRAAKKLTAKRAYSMKVRAMAPREFIALPDVEQRVMRRTADFWSEVLPG